MKFLADENLYVPITHGLKDRGHEVFIILEGGKTGTLDEEIFRIATRENRVIVTMDKHFANMLRFPSDQWVESLLRGYIKFMWIKKLEKIDFVHTRLNAKQVAYRKAMIEVAESK